MNPRILPAVGLGFLLAVMGCRMGPDYRRPSVVVPDGWRTPGAGAGAGSEPVNLPWWSFYRDPVLTQLIATALENNRDLAIAAARVEEAMAGYGAQRSTLFPEVNGAVGMSRSRSGYTQRTANTFDALGLLSYEIDVWGRLRRGTEAARAGLLASEEGRTAVRLGLVAGVAGNYFRLRALDAQLEVARRTHASRTRSLELTRVRFAEEGGRGWGIVSELDVRQAETQVHVARSSIASLERGVALAENALSFLLGGNPGPIPRGLTLGEQPLPETVPAGLPSGLLLRRPDLRAAEQQLVAANANIGAARAAYFPVISLTAALGLQSPQIDDLFTAGLSKTWKFAPQVAVPIFNAGRIRAGVRAAEARSKASLAAYEQAIQTAFREVDDALVTVATLRDQLEADQASAAAERRRLELSTLRYDAGVSSYSDVLDAERFLFNAELQAVQTRSDLLSAYAQLYKALGGGWEVEIREAGGATPVPTQNPRPSP